jgi:hypothetical protein
VINLIPLSAEREYQFFDPVEGTVTVSKKIDNRKEEKFFNKITYWLSIESLRHSSQEIIGLYNDFVELDKIPTEDRYKGLGLAYHKQVSDVLYGLLKNIFGENTDLSIEPNGFVEYYSGYLKGENEDATLIIFFTTFRDFPIFDFEFPEEDWKMEEIKIEVTD